MNDLGALIAMLSNPDQQQQPAKDQSWMQWLLNAKNGGGAANSGTGNMSGLGQGIFSMMNKGGTGAAGGGMLSSL